MDDFTQQKLYICKSERAKWKKLTFKMSNVIERKRSNYLFKIVYVLVRLIQPSLPTHTLTHTHSQTHARIRNSYV